jgi:hypothetical protein
MVIDAIECGNKQVIEDVKRVAKYTGDRLPKTPQELCNQIFHSKNILERTCLFSCKYRGDEAMLII